MVKGLNIMQCGRNAVAVLLAVVLGLYSVPLCLAYADEVADAASSDAAAEEAAPTDAAAEESGSAAPETEAPAAQESADPAPAETDTSQDSSSPSQDQGSAVAEDTGAGEEAAEEVSRNGLSTETDDSKEARAAKNVEQAQAAYDKAYDNAASAAGQLGNMGALQAELTPYFEQLALAWEDLEAAKGLREPLEKERSECQAHIKELESELEVAKEQRANALIGLLLTNKELSQAEGGGVLAAVLDVSNATEAENYEFMLARVATLYADKKQAADDHVAKVEDQITATEDRISEIDEEIKAAEAKKDEAYKALEAVVDAGNIAAFAIEKLASEARQQSKEAVTSVEKLSDKIEGVKELKESAKEWDLISNGTRAQALAQAGQWYDAVDALVGLEGAISYGCGLDFALEEADFVAKWGPAIDSFYVSQGAPMQGLGESIAKQAYAYKVDPRLCAAVSIVESSGGRYCIKPHNAWGWGAADSDPYNLASGWGSWDEAIEAWHRGMATSQTGLATTPSLTAMGDIYCSTPIWGSKVAMLMEQISGYAQAQQVVVRA